MEKVQKNQFPAIDSPLLDLRDLVDAGTESLMVLLNSVSNMRLLADL